jgi:putative ABC transport system permease protein
MLSLLVVLKGSKQGRHRSFVRNSLVVIQFAGSISLIVCTFVILNQLRYIRTSDLGYSREQILSLRTRGIGGSWDGQFRRIQILKERLLQSSDIIDATATSHLPVQIGSSGGVTVIDDGGIEHHGQSYQLYTDAEFLKVFKIPLKAGRFISPTALHDSDAAVINETFAKIYGWRKPLGKTFHHGDAPARVVGVVKDFHMHSLHEPIAPLFIKSASAHSGWIGYLSMRIRPHNVPQTLAFVKHVWSELTNDYPINYSFLDETFDAMYRNEEQLSEIVSWFTVLAILVASLGLFGLAAFVAEQRKKEIGIRKVLGASTGSVVAQLSREFLPLVVIANLLAWPASFFLMSSWLEEFAYRVSLGIVPFFLAGLSASLVAFLTVSYQSIKAARANPVESLKYE